MCWSMWASIPIFSVFLPPKIFMFTSRVVKRCRKTRIMPRVSHYQSTLQFTITYLRNALTPSDNTSRVATVPVLLAHSQNGEPIAPKHGFPLRVVLPSYIGARSVKWLEEISIEAHESQNFYQSESTYMLFLDLSWLVTSSGLQTDWTNWRRGAETSVRGRRIPPKQVQNDCAPLRTRTFMRDIWTCFWRSTTPPVQSRWQRIHQSLRICYWCQRWDTPRISLIDIV